LAIYNAGESAEIKLNTTSKLYGERAVNYLEIPHCTQPRPLWASYKRRTKNN